MMHKDNNSGAISVASNAQFSRLKKIFDAYYNFKDPDEKASSKANTPSKKKQPDKTQDAIQEFN